MNNGQKSSPRGRLPSGNPNPVDVHLGKRIRLRRMMLGLSQEELGNTVGLTFQQIQKYEYGINRVSTSRLWDIARVLNCSPSYFFEEMPGEAAALSPCHVTSESPDFEGQEDVSAKRESLTLVRAFYSINSGKVRRHIIELANSLADDPAGTAAAP